MGLEAGARLGTGRAFFPLHVTFKPTRFPFLQFPKFRFPQSLPPSVQSSSGSLRPQAPIFIAKDLYFALVFCTVPLMNPRDLQMVRAPLLLFQNQ